jgi:hypothetical protein
MAEAVVTTDGLMVLRDPLGFLKGGKDAFGIP